MTRTISRRSLYEAVWSEPVYKVAERFGITAYALAKKCRNQDIPVPERGYWKRMSCGGVTSIPSLPFKEDGDRIRIGFKQPIAGIGEPPCLTYDGKDLFVKTDHSLAASDVGNELGSNAARSLNQRLVELRNCGATTLTISASSLINVSITTGNISRVVALADELILLLKGAGYELQRSSGGLAISVGNVLVPIAITELVQPKTDVHEPAPDNLVLIIGEGKTGPGVRQRFADSPSQRVEDLLPLVIGSVAALGACAERRRRRAKIKPEIERGVVLVQKEIDRMSTLIRRFENASDRANVEKDIEEMIEWALEGVARRMLTCAEATTVEGRSESLSPDAVMRSARRA